MSIRTKLLAAFGGVLAMLLGVGLLGWWSSRTVEANGTELYENNVKAAVSLGTAQSALWELRYGFPQFIAVPEARQSILDAQPKGIWDRNTLRAAANWRYQPALKDGKPVETTGVKVKHIFELER